MLRWIHSTLFLLLQTGCIRWHVTLAWQISPQCSSWNARPTGVRFDSYQRTRFPPPIRTLRHPNTSRHVSMASEGVFDLQTATLSSTQLQQLQEQKYVIVPNFISPAFAEAIRQDIQSLRTDSQFRQAKIGQDATNTLNTDIRVAETCFIGPDKREFNRQHPNAARNALYSVLNDIRLSLMEATQVPLDASLSELLYAYYPNGGYYRTHVDAVPGSASVLRQYSLLLYVNDDTWDVEKDGGSLRLYLNTEENNNTLDVPPCSGTLVLFQSDALPHEVLDTTRERCVVVGWYNRPVRAADVAQMAPDVTTMRTTLLALAAALVTIGLVQLLH